jgi:hypothetical protein
MAKVKISKKSTKIDMTAMCDVAFLLLSFFIMTSTAKVPEPKPVDTPASTVQAKLPEHDLATITIGGSGNMIPTIIKSNMKIYMVIGRSGNMIPTITKSNMKIRMVIGRSGNMIPTITKSNMKLRMVIGRRRNMIPTIM